MRELKIIPIERNPQEAIKAGQVCPLPGKGIGPAKGAMGSAIVTIIL